MVLALLYLKQFITCYLFFFSFRFYFISFYSRWTITMVFFLAKIITMLNMTVTMRYLLITLCHNIIIIIMIMIYYSYLLKIYIILSSNTIIYFLFFSLCQIMSKSHKIISSRNPMVHFITWHYRQVFFVILNISHFNNNFMLF